MVYFHNDYFSMTGSKEQWLQSAVESAKTAGVRKFVAVLPVEYEFYYTEGQDIDKRREEAWARAQETFQGLTILRPSIVYGTHNYLVKYIQQSVAAGNIPPAFKSADAKFRPVHHDAVARAVNHALDNNTSGVFSLNGQENLSIQEITATLAHQQGSHPDQVKSAGNLFGFADILNEFWSGVSHDSNMVNMIQHFAHGDGLSETDFFEAQGLSHEEPKLSEVFSTKDAPSFDDLKEPLFIDYKRISLN